MSIRFKVILPYLILTLAVAVIGVYVVTRLVANSLSERLTNQLLEAGRVVSDDFARQEISHVESARIIAYTRGVAEALLNGDHDAALSAAQPAAAGLSIENLILIDLQQSELIQLIKTSNGFLDVDYQTGAASLPIVWEILSRNDPGTMPRRSLGLNPVDARYYYYTALPVSLEGGLVGVVLVGTSIDTILPYLQDTSLADVIIYGESGRAIASTLGVQVNDPLFVATISMPVETYQQTITTNGIVSGENITVNGRSYSLARGPIQVGDDRLGVFAVVLPLNFVTQAGSLSRNTYVALFAAAMFLVVLIGFGISRLIVNPLASLADTSQAIAGGDLTRRTGIRRSDEIGTLASSFDQMSANLEKRTSELEDANRVLAQLDRAKADFIQISGHEMRTPLTLIKGYAQMLEMKAQSDPELEVLSRGVLEGTERMSLIVNSMLDVSKIDSRVLDVVPAKVQIGLMIEGIERKFKPDLTRRNLIFKRVGLDDLPVFDADPDLLYKVFYHLIINAIKYTPNGGQITISGNAVLNGSGASEIEIAVSDTGVGIAPEHRDLIFEKFYQTGDIKLHSSGSTKFKGGGPGLGLAIARGIVQAHKGRIWAESSGYDEKTCPGSRFVVRLPIKGGEA